MTRGHATPSRAREEPLYDLQVATPSHAEQARTLVASLRTASLGTAAKDPKGHPYVSFVTFAIDSGDPIFLVSELAEHTQNLRGDTRASLLVAENRAPDPLANARVTLLGHCRPVAEGDTAARQSYLEQLPNAAYYCDFADFGFWRLEIDSIRYIGGYGRMSWVSSDAWYAAGPDPLARHAEGIVEHMNADHADAMVLLCRVFSRAEKAETVTMAAIDRYGFEMSVETQTGPRPVRLAFPEPVSTPDEARQALVAMVKDARSQ